MRVTDARHDDAKRLSGDVPDARLASCPIRRAITFVFSGRLCLR